MSIPIHVEMQRQYLPVNLKSPAIASVQGAGEKSMANASNEIEWAADRKVGFAMGILLIGVVAALFFRNEPLSVKDAPSVEREDLIDDRLRDRNVSVYTDSVDSDSDDDQQTWTLPELLNEYGQQDGGTALPIGTAELSGQQTSRSPDRPQKTESSQSPLFEPPVAMGKPLPNRSRQPDNFDSPDFLEDPDSSYAASESTNYDEYTIRYGDTLSGIAGKLLGAPGRYQEIYDANRDRMASPDRLKVGAAIRIPRL